MKINHHAQRSSSVAFTLIELLVVIVVIALLVAITLPITRYAARRAKEAKQEAMLVQIRAALDEYRATYGEYPITPIIVTNDGVVSVQNEPEVAQHYPYDYKTLCSNSPFTNVNLVSTTNGTFERLSTVGVSGDGTSYEVDYCLTYPLMLKQLEKKRRPFMEFDEITLFYMVYRLTDSADPDKDMKQWTETRRTRSGGIERNIVQRGIYGNPVNRVKAIDPLTGNQWKYECHDGVNYQLSTHSFR